MHVRRWLLGSIPLVWLGGGCAGTTTFQGTTPQAIVGVAPEPPPPQPEPPPPPPPRVEVRDNQIVIHEKIQFDLDKATIKAESSSLL